ncbi:hypothetical protein Metbo_1612 [Methanobacterium lacus]|uniref:Glycerophosphoryl diester phosphodiesterase membrane domain-containing protein n=1 Tax=Methanobacterium lacus (strain AL-21) TaxID=877455 RepID=F0T988_METLA|nr:DUF4013 domain-containing protein [Methanobacterium lacus]ADZ09839.1 hypothetical protein Metbo_1612 [Methanobacterium lacus]
MDIGDIVKNSLGYPLSNKKNFLILGVIILFAEIYSIVQSFGFKSSIFGLFLILTLLLMIFRSGYNLRILNSSIGGYDVLPDFGNWMGMFKDGVKIWIVLIIFIIPLLILLFVFGFIISLILISSGASTSVLGKIMLMAILAIVGIYLIIVYPLILMALANMAKNENNISYALKLSEIRTKISEIGLGNYIGWYIVTGIIYAVIIIIGTTIIFAFGLGHVKFIGIIINALIIGPFASIFLYRSTSLMYRSVLELENETDSSEDPELTI